MKYLKEKDIKPGMLIRAKFTVNPDKAIYDGYYLPLIVIAEYDRFFQCEVLPHRNPNMSYGMSAPYPMTINKFALKTGSVSVKEFWELTKEEGA